MWLIYGETKALRDNGGGGVKRGAEALRGKEEALKWDREALNDDGKA